MERSATLAPRSEVVFVLNARQHQGNQALLGCLCWAKLENSRHPLRNVLKNPSPFREAMHEGGPTKHFLGSPAGTSSGRAAPDRPSARKGSGEVQRSKAGRIKERKRNPFCNLWSSSSKIHTLHAGLFAVSGLAHVIVESFLCGRQAIWFCWSATPAMKSW